MISKDWKQFTRISKKDHRRRGFASASAANDNEWPPRRLIV
jgi:hypothetical protein